MSDIASKPTEKIKVSRESVSIPGATTSVYQALYGRRMAWKFRDRPVPQAAIQRMLDSAVWAPNHRLTEPWRFFVLEKDGQARRQAAQLAYDFALERNNNTDRARAAQQKVLDPPVVIYVYCVPGPNYEVTQENYASVCCAIQNICLAGVAEGVAVAWETGGPTRHPALKSFLGAEDDWTLAAMLLIGFPEEAISSRRTPASEFVRFLS